MGPVVLAVVTGANGVVVGPVVLAVMTGASIIVVVESRARLVATRLAETSLTGPHPVHGGPNGVWAQLCNQCSTWKPS